MTLTSPQEADPAALPEPPTTGDAAPFHAEVADAPGEARSSWVAAPDGVRLRVTLLARGASGTVLLFPGRTEYAEKYGPVARHLGAAGLSVLTIDWRGQGLSARLLANAEIGHVVAFADYQGDVAALVGAADALGLPGPRHLLAHSMGGAIGLRALMDGLPAALGRVQRADVGPRDGRGAQARGGARWAGRRGPSACRRATRPARGPRATPTRPPSRATC